MGLVSLALAHAEGLAPGARGKTLRTLRAALGLAKVNGKAYVSRRARAGWFRHWFDIRDGSDNDASRGDGYSTIDTAILVAGAQLAADYYGDAGLDADGEVRRLADRLLTSVDWDSAVADLAQGRLTLNFDLSTEKPKAATAVFNEYLVVACVGAYAERKLGRRGAIAEFWDRHYASPAKLPKKSYEGIELLTDWPGHYLSSFVPQFAAYLCSDVSRSEEYLGFVRNAAEADRRWFSHETEKPYLWGLGAGEVRYRDAAGLRKEYAANNVGENPHRVVSPHVIAGFLPVYPRGARDLLTLAERRECLYSHGGHDILWRCSLDDLSLPFDRLQAVDFSSMVFGLSTLDPAVNGWSFFQKYAPRAR
jgi:hypothetical protein